ncbi:MAG: alpha/beta hydrolase [Pseudomonadota bacterium]
MDWDAAYDNRATVKDFNEFLENWTGAAQAFRQQALQGETAQLDLPYGSGDRNRFDLFEPDNNPKGVVIFIHGGYWRSLDKSYWSHLAQGALEHGWAFAVPSYTLAPNARIGKITSEIASAITSIAAMVSGPIRLCGHSAGGHLVARMNCTDSMLVDEVFDRVEKTIAISGVFDLEHLPKTAMNADLRIDQHEILSESPARLSPRKGARVHCLVGGNELDEFKRQNDLLIPWEQHGARVTRNIAAGYNHFSVIEPLADPASPLVQALFA